MAAATKLPHLVINPPLPRIYLSEVMHMVKRWLRRGTALVLAAVTLVTVAAAADDSTPDGGSAAK